jgi:DNA invertase Pin-like site-specific DNA recombinase
MAGNCAAIDIWKLDRLSRSLRDLIHIMEQVHAAGAAFRSLTEAIDTTTAAGRMLMQMLGSIAEFEREIIRERTHAGLAEARRHGRVGGRRHKLSPEARAEAVEDVLSGRKTIARVARAYGVHPSTISRLATQSLCKSSAEVRPLNSDTLRRKSSRKATS